MSPRAAVPIELTDTAERWWFQHAAERQAVAAFVTLMVNELAANDSKGNRPGWLQMDRKEAMGEIGWHLAKLQVAAKRRSEIDDAGLRPSTLADEGVREYGADVANQAMMALDVMGLL